MPKQLTGGKRGRPSAKSLKDAPAGYPMRVQSFGHAIHRVDWCRVEFIDFPEAAPGEGPSFDAAVRNAEKNRITWIQSRQIELLFEWLAWLCDGDPRRISINVAEWEIPRRPETTLRTASPLPLSPAQRAAAKIEAEAVANARVLNKKDKRLGWWAISAKSLIDEMRNQGIAGAPNDEDTIWTWRKGLPAYLFEVFANIPPRLRPRDTKAGMVKFYRI